MKKNTLSQTPEAIRSRRQRVDRKAKKLAEKNASAPAPYPAPPGGPMEPPAPAAPVPASTASIGVETPEKPAPAAAQAYHCSNCDEDITPDMDRCPMCEESLHWPEGLR
jgi:hypothetical protein